MNNPRAAILMGSDSDLPVMRKAADEFDGMGVDFRMTVASAHRSPEYVREFIRKSETDGVQVFTLADGPGAGS